MILHKEINSYIVKVFGVVFSIKFLRWICTPVRARLRYEHFNLAAWVFGMSTFLVAQEPGSRITENLRKKDHHAEFCQGSLLYIEEHHIKMLHIIIWVLRIQWLKNQVAQNNLKRISCSSLCKDSKNV